MLKTQNNDLIVTFVYMYIIYSVLFIPATIAISLMPPLTSDDLLPLSN